MIIQLFGFIMEFLKQFTFVNYILSNNYLHALSVFISFYIFSYIGVYIIENFLLKLALKTETDLDDLIVEKLKKYVSPILIILGIVIAIEKLGIDNILENYIQKGFLSVLIITITLLISSIIHIILRHWGMGLAKKTKSKFDDQLVKLFHRLANVIIWSISFMFILQYWDVKIGPLLASLGVAGIAVAFALQNTLGNIFGGISMIIDKSIKVGDVVELDKETNGTVLDVGIRSTRIRTWNNEVIIVPNGNLANARIINYVQPDDKVRVVVPFGVAYGSDIDKVKKIVMKEIVKISNFIPEPVPLVRFLEMGSSSLNFKAYFYVKKYDQRFAALDEANTKIYNALNKNKIGIPFPQMDVWIKEYRK
jgi:MscS family membrane protein